jgi:uncharacterized cupredoxin-like copper-binding protein
MMAGQAAALATGPAASPVLGARTVGVELAEYSVKLDASSVPAGPLHFVVSNTGQRGHQLQVYPSGMASGGAHGIQMAQGGMMRGTVGFLQLVAPGQTAALDVTLTAGSWELACHLMDSENGKSFDHYDRGMKTTLTVN